MGDDDKLSWLEIVIVVIIIIIVLVLTKDA